MADMVRITFEATARVPVRGTMSIPRRLWDGRSDDDQWTRAIELYITERVEGEHYDLDDANPGDLDFDWVEEAKS